MISLSEGGDGASILQVGQKNLAVESLQLTPRSILGRVWFSEMGSGIIGLMRVSISVY